MIGTMKTMVAAQIVVAVVVMREHFSVIVPVVVLRKTMINDQVIKCSYYKYPNLINLGKVYIFLIDI